MLTMCTKWRSSGRNLLTRGCSLHSTRFVLPPFAHGVSSSGSDANDVESEVSNDSAHAGKAGDMLTHLLQNVCNEWDGSSSIPLPELYA